MHEYLSTRLHCRDIVGKEDLCVVLTASLGMGVGRRSGGDLGGTHAHRASASPGDTLCASAARS